MRYLSRCSGLSLVELMISMLVGAILTASFGYFAVQKTREYQTQALVMRLQKERDVARERIRQDIREAVLIGAEGQVGTPETGTDLSGIVPACVTFSAGQSCESPNGIYVLRYGDNRSYLQAIPTEARAITEEGWLTIPVNRAVGSFISQVVAGDWVVVESGGLSQLFTVAAPLDTSDPTKVRIQLGEAAPVRAGALNALAASIRDANVRVFKVTEVLWALNGTNLYRFRRGDLEEVVPNAGKPFEELISVTLKSGLKLSDRSVSSHVSRFGVQIFPCYQQGVAINPFTYTRRNKSGFGETDDNCYSHEKGGVNYRNVNLVSIALIMQNPASIGGAGLLGKLRFDPKYAPLVAAYFSEVPTRYGGQYVSKTLPTVTERRSDTVCPTKEQGGFNCAAIDMGLCPEQEGDPEAQAECACDRLLGQESDDVDRDIGLCCSPERLCSDLCVRAIPMAFEGTSICDYPPDTKAGRCCKGCSNWTKHCQCETLTPTQKCQCGDHEACCLPEAMGPCSTNCAVEKRCGGECTDPSTICNSCRAYAGITAEALNQACCKSPVEFHRCEPTYCNQYCRPESAATEEYLGCPQKSRYCTFTPGTCAYQDVSQNCELAECKNAHSWSSGVNLRYCKYCRSSGTFNSEHCCDVYSPATCDEKAADGTTPICDENSATYCSSYCGRCDVNCYQPNKADGIPLGEICTRCPYLTYYKDVAVKADGTTMGQFCVANNPCNAITGTYGNVASLDVTPICGLPLYGDNSNSVWGCLTKTWGVSWGSNDVYERICQLCPADSNAAKVGCCNYFYPSLTNPLANYCHPKCENRNCICDATPDQYLCNVGYMNYAPYCSVSDLNQKLIYYCESCREDTGISAPECDACSPEMKAFYDDYATKLGAVGVAYRDHHRCTKCNEGCCDLSMQTFIDAGLLSLWWEACPKCTNQLPGCSVCRDPSYYCTNDGWATCQLGAAQLDLQFEIDWAADASGQTVAPVNSTEYFNSSAPARCQCFLQYHGNENYMSSQNEGFEACCDLLKNLIGVPTSEIVKEIRKYAALICPLKDQCPQTATLQADLDRACGCTNIPEKYKYCDPICQTDRDALCNCVVNQAAYQAAGYMDDIETMGSHFPCEVCCNRSIVSLDDYRNKLGCSDQDAAKCAITDVSGGD